MSLRYHRYYCIGFKFVSASISYEYHISYHPSSLSRIYVGSWSVLIGIAFLFFMLYKAAWNIKYNPSAVTRISVKMNLCACASVLIGTFL